MIELNDLLCNKNQNSCETRGMDQPFALSIFPSGSDEPESL